MAAQRQNFVFPDAASPMNYEARKASALEFIAHYLDRIEAHLERLAAVAESNNGEMTKVALQMTSVAHLLAKIEAKTK